MYVKRIQLHNYGPIARFDIMCPFDEEDKPKPIVLVGENGSGKSIVLAHIVNGLLSAQQIVYPENQEVDEGKVYKFRTARYIQSGKEYSFSQVDFENDLYISELQLQRAKKNYPYFLDGIEGIGVQDAWNSMRPEMNSVISGTFQPDQKTRIEDIFSTRCALYFPPNRFEEPGWLNQKNLKSKAQYTNLTHIRGDTNRKVINYSPLHDNQNWLFDVSYDYNVSEVKPRVEAIRAYIQAGNFQAPLPRIIIDGASEKAENDLYGTVIKAVQIMMPHIEGVRLGFGMRWDRSLGVQAGGKTCVPNIFQLSSGEVSLLNLCFSILRDYDLCRSSFDGPENVRGIVVVDEIDLHLHAKHQYEILPNLMMMFPRIQFVVTTHSPLFVLGLRRIFGDDGFVVHHLPHGERIDPEEFGEFGDAYCAFSDTRKHANVIANAIRNSRIQLVFVEGKTDAKYLHRAAELLEMQEALNSLEIRDGGGSRTLKNIWSCRTKDHIEHPIVVLLYDCDNKVESGKRGNVFCWTIPKIESHPIQKGIENRFSRETLEKATEHKRAFIDIEGKHESMRRGVSEIISEQWTVNEDEKTNLCNWLCENGTAEDFKHFQEIFDELGKIPGLFRARSNQN